VIVASGVFYGTPSGIRNDATRVDALNALNALDQGLDRIVPL
jgi:hypothetical protein